MWAVSHVRGYAQEAGGSADAPLRMAGPPAGSGGQPPRAPAARRGRRDYLLRGVRTLRDQTVAGTGAGVPAEDWAQDQGFGPHSPWAAPPLDLFFVPLITFPLIIFGTVTGFSDSESLDFFKLSLLSESLLS